MKLSVSWWQILNFLLAQEGHRAYRTEIGRGLGMQEEPVRVSIQALLELGLVEKWLPGEGEDPRRRYIALTPLGLKAVAGPLPEEAS